MALGRNGEAADDWSRALAHDDENPDAHLGRAQALLLLGQVDAALADLEKAIALCGPAPRRIRRIALLYAQCLPARPDRLSRVLALAARTLDRGGRSATR
jgi:tetratricopeptide (TPR) repeat protein